MYTEATVDYRGGPSLSIRRGRQRQSGLFHSRVGFLVSFRGHEAIDGDGNGYGNGSVSDAINNAWRRRFTEMPATAPHVSALQKAQGVSRTSHATKEK